MCFCNYGLVTKNTKVKIQRSRNQTIAVLPTKFKFLVQFVKLHCSTTTVSTSYSVCAELGAILGTLIKSYAQNIIFN